MISDIRKILVLALALGMIWAVGSAPIAQAARTVGEDAAADTAVSDDAATNGAAKRSATDATEAALAREYLELTHQLASAEAIAKAVGAQIVRQRPESRLDVEDAAEAVAPEYEDEVEAMNEQVVAVYAKRFTAEELQAMVDFYRDFSASPAGQKLQAQREEIGEELGEISRLRGVVIGGEMYRALVDKLNGQEQPMERPE